jgi:5-methyltetrahydrofolate--homocysteine methyltransferase
MLPDSHPLQILSNIDNEELLSSTILRASTGSHLEIIFGIVPADTGDRNYPDSLSTLELDDRFDPSSIEAQDYLVSFCDRLFELPFVYKSSEDFKCSINAFDSWLSEQYLLPTGSQDIDYITSCDNARSLPMQEESFHPCFIAWSIGTSDSSVLSWNSKVRTLIINLGTRVKFDTPLGETRLEWEKFEEFQKHELTLRSPSDLNFFQTSAIWWWNDTFQMMQSTGLSSLYIAISASAIIILLSSRSPFLAFASAISICFILATSTATLVVLGWELGFLEWICFAILVGLSADFVIHLR